MAKSFEGLLLDAAAAELSANSAGAVAAVNAAEGGLEAFLANAIANIKVSNPILALILPPIEQGVVAYLIAEEQKFPGSVVVPVILAYLTNLAAKVGG